MSNYNALVFTDLDGTLLDHHTYEWKAADSAIQALLDHNIPIIMNTSKTLPECLEWQLEMGFEGPIIYENGAGIAIPKQMLLPSSKHIKSSHKSFYLCSDSLPYQRIRELITLIRDEGDYQFRGFGDMSVAEICAHTQQTEHQAVLAKTRHHTEPLVWLDTPERKTEFVEALKKRNLSTLQGGRFLHVIGDHNKGSALKKMTQILCDAQKQNTQPFIIALGDSPNDAEMLHQADAAILIRKPDDTWMAYDKVPKNNIVIQTDGQGPTGWNQAIHTLMTKEELYG